MPGYVGVTDFDWFNFLAAQPGIEEVNFWKPGGTQGFAAVPPGAPFLFKLHAPRNVADAASDREVPESSTFTPGLLDRLHRDRRPLLLRA